MKMDNVAELYMFICDYNKKNGTKYGLLLASDGVNDSNGLVLVDQSDDKLKYVVGSFNDTHDDILNNHHYIREWMRDNLGV